jgi:hypothetical protein
MDAYSRKHWVPASLRKRQISFPYQKIESGSVFQALHGPSPPSSALSTDLHVVMVHAHSGTACIQKRLLTNPLRTGVPSSCPANGECEMCWSYHRLRVETA